jgi:hypothetical protein
MRTFKCGRAGGSYANLGAGRPGGLRGTESPVANLSAVGQGAYGGQSPLCRIYNVGVVKNLSDVCNRCCVYI